MQRFLDLLCANLLWYRQLRKGVWILWRTNLTFAHQTFWTRYETSEEAFQVEQGNSSPLKMEDWNHD